MAGLMQRLRKKLLRREKPARPYYRTNYGRKRTRTVRDDGYWWPEREDM